MTDRSADRPTPPTADRLTGHAGAESQVAARHMATVLAVWHAERAQDWLDRNDTQFVADLAWATTARTHAAIAQVYAMLADAG